MTTVKQITDGWVERRKLYIRRQVKRHEFDRRSNYQASYDSIMCAPYDQETIEAQIEALKGFK